MKLGECTKLQMSTQNIKFQSQKLASIETARTDFFRIIASVCVWGKDTTRLHGIKLTRHPLHKAETAVLWRVGDATKMCSFKQ